MSFNPKPKLRFAPSPNGNMHWGHAYSALLNVKMARALGAEFIIRMEDIDVLRCTSAQSQACLEDLAAIGVVSDGEIMYQSTRQNAYNDAIEKLFTLGVLYPCLATRGVIKRHYSEHEKQFDPDGGLIYPHLYKNLSLLDQRKILQGKQEFTLRLDMEATLEILNKKGQKFSFWNFDLEQNKMMEIEFNPLLWGDVVIARKDIGTSYHLSVVVDDAAQHISHIVRGMDLFYSTYIHRVLQMLLELPEPIYCHHELILNADKDKLAKSTKSQPIRETGVGAQEQHLITDLLEAVNMRKLATIFVVNV